MIILSVGLPKSGSAWYYYMTNDLVVAAGHDDSTHIKEKYNLHHILKFPTCNIQEPTAEKLDLLLKPPVIDSTFTVKTHFPPNDALLKYMNSGDIKVTLMIRDPRDIALSGFEAGVAMRYRGKRGTFANITTLAEAIIWTERWLDKTWSTWKRIDGILKVKYEDVLLSPLHELNRLSDFLDFQIPKESLQAIASHWSKNSGAKKNPSIGHFNKGISGRHRQAIRGADLALCRERLGEYIEAMGYVS